MANRVILIVLDSVGIGELPDANLYNDAGSNTLGHIAEKSKLLSIPNLCEFGLGNIVMQNLIPKANYAKASFGKLAEVSAGKDTTTGHWEIAGTPLKQAFPTFPNGFPNEFISTFEKAIGIKTIGNYSASGTEIINQLGDEHVASGNPIIYTSADSVFQIAMHEEIIPLDRQYEICSIARNLLIGELAVGRVIARPFTGKNGNYQRTKNRKDFSLSPPYNLLNAVTDAGKEVIGVGKISDIFNDCGISYNIKTSNNLEGINETINLIKKGSKGLIFTNLVDFDMHYGHRRDIDGYARCLNEFDESLPRIIEAMKDTDVLIITADHGNDPSHHGTDHTREYVPFLIYGNEIKKNVNIGSRSTFADIAATIAEILGIEFETPYKSFAPMVKL